MKKLVLIVLLVLTVFVPLTAAGAPVQEGDISAGVLLGQPFALTGKYVIDKELSAEAVIGVGVGSGLSIRADVMYNFLEFAIEDIDLYPYAGGGLNINLGSGFGLGLAFPVGVAYYFDDYPIEVYLELTPGLNIIGGFNATFGGGIGGRYSFDM